MNVYLEHFLHTLRPTIKQELWSREEPYFFQRTPTETTTVKQEPFLLTVFVLILVITQTGTRGDPTDRSKTQWSVVQGRGCPSCKTLTDDGTILSLQQESLEHDIENNTVHTGNFAQLLHYIFCLPTSKQSIDRKGKAHLELTYVFVHIRSKFTIQQTKQYDHFTHEIS